MYAANDRRFVVGHHRNEPTLTGFEQSSTLQSPSWRIAPINHPAALIVYPYICRMTSCVKGGGKTYHWAEQNCTTGVMPDGHGLAGWAGGSRLERGRGRPWQGANRRLADPTLALARQHSAHSNGAMWAGGILSGRPAGALRRGSNLAKSASTAALCAASRWRVLLSGSPVRLVSASGWCEDR